MWRFTTCIWVCWLHCKIMGCNCKYKDSENRGKVWVLFSLASFKIPYLLYSFQLSVIKRFICYAFQYLSKTGSINRLRSLKTLYTKSTPVYDLRVCIAYTSCISLLCIMNELFCNCSLLISLEIVFQKESSICCWSSLKKCIKHRQ